MEVREETYFEDCRSLSKGLYCNALYREIETHRHPGETIPVALVPLPDQWSAQNNNGRKRNERERDRVRYVNESYARLQERLPLLNVKRRISKVQTLRCAIKYIRQLQKILTDI